MVGWNSETVYVGGTSTTTFWITEQLSFLTSHAIGVRKWGIRNDLMFFSIIDFVCLDKLPSNRRTSYLKSVNICDHAALSFPIYLIRCFLLKSSKQPRAPTLTSWRAGGLVGATGGSRRPSSCGRGVGIVERASGFGAGCDHARPRGEGESLWQVACHELLLMIRVWYASTPKSPFQIHL